MKVVGEEGRKRRSRRKLKLAADGVKVPHKGSKDCQSSKGETGNLRHDIVLKRNSVRVPYTLWQLPQ